MDFSYLTALLLHHLVVFSLMLQSHGGLLQLIGPSQPIVATIGDDITLPCHLEPASDASGMALEWTRPDLRPEFVLRMANGREDVSEKHPSYRGRTSVSIDQLKHGDVSLKLSRVEVHDEGRYSCHVPSLGQPASIELVVGAASSPVVSVMNRTRGRVVLQCESKGWYPEPEVSWLRGEVDLLSKELPETVRGPDGLYTVSSRVTVEIEDDSSFTCRVHQKNINQTRETQIYVQVSHRDGLIWYEKCILASGIIAVFVCAVFLIRGCRKRLCA